MKIIFCSKNNEINLLKSNFAKKVLTLATGTVASQLITIALTPILTRLYSPKDFGDFTIFFSIVSVLALLATGRYELGIVLPKSDRHALSVVHLSFFLSIIFFFFFFFFLLIFNHVGRYGNTRKIYQYWYLLPSVVAVFSFYQIVTCYNLRLENYKIISFNRIIQSITNSLSQIVFGVFSFGFIGMIAGFALGYVVGLLLFVKKNQFSFFIPKLTYLKRLLVLSRKYSRFPKYELPQSVIDSFHNYGIYFIIGYFYSASDVGLFALATRIAFLPSSVIGGAMASVFYSSAAKDRDNLYRLTTNLLKKLILLSACFYISLFIVAERIVLFVFGEEWRNSGLIIKYLCFWLFLKFISSPISTIPMIINKQNVFLLFGVIYNIAIFGSFSILAILGYSLLDSIFVTYVFSSSFLILVISWIIFEARRFNEI